MQRTIRRKLRREDIDRAALAIMRRGEQIRNSKIALELGISQSSLWHYITSKEDIAAHVKCLKSNWNPLVRSRVCAQALSERVKAGRYVWTEGNGFNLATGIASGWYEEYARSYPRLLSHSIRMHNLALEWRRTARWARR